MEAIPEGHTSTPIFFIAILNKFLSSAFLIALRSAPINSILYFSKIPDSANSTEIFKAVCPPIVGKRASGLSISIICSTTEAVNGSTYVLFAVSGSVIIEAGLELTKMTSKPSLLSALHACVPE